MTKINDAIEAKGFVSMECKKAVSQYGDLIWQLLLSGVCLSLIFLLLYI